MEPGLTAKLAKTMKDAPNGVALLTTLSPEREFSSLVRGESFQIGGRTFTLVGGVAVRSFLARLARESAIAVSLILSRRRIFLDTGTTSASAQEAADLLTGTLEVPLIPMTKSERRNRSKWGRPTSGNSVPGAASGPAAQRGFLVSLDRGGHGCHRLAAGGVGVVANQRTAGGACRKDGRARSRSPRRRLRSGHGRSRPLCPGFSATLRRACARARPGCARPNGARPSAIWPARSITTSRTGSFRCATSCGIWSRSNATSPAALPSVFAERRPTVDSSIAYLETLATSYQRLSPRPDRRDCDLNALITDVVRAAQGHEQVEFEMDLSRVFHGGRVTRSHSGESSRT